MAVTEKRASFKTWTILLSILGFSLSLLGTFLVRSGVLTSVHSFAADPGRGLFILIFLLVVIGSSLLFAFRAHKLRSVGSFSLISRESGLLVNNVILLVMTATVLLGTLYPLIIDALGSGKISVGPPYFNSVIVPLAMVLFMVMGFGFFLRWKKDSASRVLKKTWMPLAASLVIAFVLPLLVVSEFNFKTVLGLFAGSWITLAALMWVVSLGRSPFKLPLASWGSVIAHIGMAVTVIGVTLVSLYDTEKDVRLEKGQSYEMAGYTFSFEGVEPHKGANYTANRATMTITQDGKHVTTVHPEKRDYGRDAMAMTEAGIDAGFTRDLFIALGEPLGKDAWSFRLYHKPFVRWIWLGGILMGLGGLLAALDKRYRRMRKIVVEPIDDKSNRSIQDHNQQVQRHEVLYSASRIWYLIALLLFGLNNDPKAIPSPFVGKPAPEFELPRLYKPDQTISVNDMKGQVWVLNLWASWCVSCRAEHKVLSRLIAAKKVPTIGLNYKDYGTEDYGDDALQWLADIG